MNALYSTRYGYRGQQRVNNESGQVLLILIKNDIIIHMKREAAAAFGIALIIPLSSGCTGPENDKGYIVEGTVTEVDDDHVEINDLTVISGNLAAEERLADGREEIDDNYSDFACYNHETSEDLDKALDAGRIAVGSRVRVEANIGYSYYNCVIPGKTSITAGDRAILESLEVL